MEKFSVTLSSIADVKHFVSTACMQDCEIDLISGRYIVDAKSIMGIFSLDLSRPITVDVHGTAEQAAAFRAAVKEFTVH